MSNIDWSKMKTVEQQQADATAALKLSFEFSIQLHIDATVKLRNYSDGNALAGYVNSTVPQWSAEATAFIAWRDQVWIYAYAELEKVMDGEREIPTVEDFIAELPVITWPS